MHVAEAQTITTLRSLALSLPTDKDTHFDKDAHHKNDKTMRYTEGWEAYEAHLLSQRWQLPSLCCIHSCCHLRFSQECSARRFSVTPYLPYSVDKQLPEPMSLLKL
jgi:hypothetical protein